MSSAFSVKHLFCFLLSLPLLLSGAEVNPKMQNKKGN